MDIESNPFNFVCHKLNIIRDIPGYIPRNLLVVENALSVYNVNKPDEIRYYESATKLDDHLVIAVLKIRRTITYEKDGLKDSEKSNIKSII